MSTADETTPLLGSDTLVDRSPPKTYFKQNRKFHICAFVSLLVILALAGAATVWFLSENKRVTITPDSRNASLKQLLSNTWPRPDQQIQNVSFSAAIAAIVNEAIDEGKQTLELREAIEGSIDPISVNSPSYKHQYAIVYSPIGYNLSKLGYVENEATKFLQNKGYKSIIHYESASNLTWAAESECMKFNENMNCNLSRYRTINGSCNNLNNPQTWGVAMTPFRRALPANYSDGVSAPRGGFVTELPSARDISTLVHRPVHREDDKFTVMMAVWGQFIDHDITATALSRGANGSTISCCNAKVNHPECFPVILDEKDEYYSKYNLTCMEFVRSAPALRCSFGPREQLNQASSYLDASMIYGNTEDLTVKLRTFQGGRLEMSYTKNGRELLPFSKDPVDGCNQAEEIKKGRYCFLSGDSRANENTHLTSIHLIFARQHNKIVKQLSTLNPQWNDEELYQEARHIVTAQVQHITYNEFLPIVIGSDLMTELKLYSSTNGYWNLYNSSIEATISNNFAASSFRFAHTLIPRVMKFLANDTSSPAYVEMHKMLFNPFGLYEGDLDAIIRAAIDTDIEKADNYFTTQLTEHLFESYSNTTKTFGLDLVALNIQRGRDHGLPTYPHWREYCGFSRVTTFEDLESIFDEQSLKIISSIYKSVDEIDLYTGSLSEYPIEGGLVGPTLTCLITDQFFRLKYGDRYWYETNEKPQAFTQDQLNEIRKTSLAGILCQNADDLDYITPLVMRSASSENNHTLCSNIPQPNLTTFKDNRTNEHLPRHKISQIHIQTDNLTATWNNSAVIPSDLIDKLMKNGISWKGIVSNDDKITKINGSFSFPSSKNGTNGKFEIKYNDADGFLKLPNDTEIWSPVYTSDTIEFAPERNETYIPFIIFGNKTSGEFSWNGTFSGLLPPHNISSKELNAEKVEYQPIFSNNNGKKKRTWRPKTNSTHEKSYYFSNEIHDDVYKDYHADDIDPRLLQHSKLFPHLNREKNSSYVFTPEMVASDTEMVPDAKEALKFYNTTEAAKNYPEIFKLKPLKEVENVENEREKTCRTTFITESLKIKSTQLFNIIPPTNAPIESYTNKIFIWQWYPKTTSIRGNFTGDKNGTFSLKYKLMEGCPLTPDCVYYSRIVSSPIFETPITEAEGCSRIAPVIFDGPTWNGNVTIIIRELAKSLEKENNLSLNPEEIRHQFKNVTGTISIALDEGDVLLWNSTLPAIFEPKLNWLESNDTVAYPVSWSGFYIDKLFIGSFLLPEKQEDSVIWHEGKFSFNLGNHTNTLEAFQVYTAVVYLTAKDDVGFDLSELEELTDWDLNQYARIILKGNFSNGKFYWFGDLTLIIPKIVDDSKSSTYRPSIKYAGKVLGGTLYAELNGPKYMWWSGAIPSTILIPAEMPRGYKHIFDQVLLWTFNPANATLGHALFVTHGNQSRISLSGDFDFQITSLLNSPSLSPNVTYYSPIILQQSTYDFSDDLVENLPKENSLGTLAPLTLLGKYLRKERLFAWNGKFIISVVGN